MITSQSVGNRRSATVVQNHPIGRVPATEQKIGFCNSLASADMIRSTNSSPEEPTVVVPTATGSKAVHSTNTNEVLEDLMRLIPPCNSPVRVLVADDNLLTLISLQRLLDKWGFSYVLCKNGREASHALARDKFDLALVDLQMPEKDGVDLMREVRSDAASPNATTPLVALAGSDDEGILQQLAAIGVEEYLFKPFEPGQLFRMLTNHTHQRLQQPVHLFTELFDQEELTRLYDHDYEHINYMFSLFLHNTLPSLKTIERAVQKQDWEAATREVHKIKPTFSMVGLGNITKLANRLERSLKVGKYIPYDFQKFKQQVNKALHAVVEEQKLLSHYLK